MQGGDQCRQFLLLDVLELVLSGYFENYKIFVNLLNSIKIPDLAIGATLRTAGNETTTGTDTVSSSIAGASNAIVVGAAAATHFTLAAPASASGGIAFSFTVTARDQFDNVATGYGGTVHFTSSDSQATLPPDAPLTNGTGTFSATFRTPGSQTITAPDTVNSAITGSAAISSVAAIPTLGTWSFLLLALGLAAVAVRTLRLCVVACVDRRLLGQRGCRECLCFVSLPRRRVVTPPKIGDRSRRGLDERRSTKARLTRAGIGPSVGCPPGQC